MSVYILETRNQSVLTDNIPRRRHRVPISDKHPNRSYAYSCTNQEYGTRDRMISRQLYLLVSIHDCFLFLFLFFFPKRFFWVGKGHVMHQDCGSCRCLCYVWGKTGTPCCTCLSSGIYCIICWNIVVLVIVGTVWV